MKIVLASQSPRRRQLLGQMGLEFTTQSPEIDEAAFQGRDARDLVQILSREKARWIAGQVDPETLVIGADTVVVRDGEILGKPKGEEEARAMLASLSGRTHQVCTGVTVCRGDKVLTQVEETQVTFRPLTDQEIRQYVSTGEPMDKAGAYGIQGLGALLKARDEDLRRQGEPGVEQVTLVGLCTDICVISNALLVKAFLPEAEVVVDAACCAGVTPESHRAALAAMGPCQITVENET